MTTWRYWWARFSDGKPSRFVQADGAEAARVRAAQFGAVRDVRTLPYPTRGGDEADMPRFCYRPNECAGRTACPQAYSCTE